MKSAGNDIVALNAASIERAANPAFYNKFITASEVELHQQTGLNVLPFAHYNWLLWSVKESAFKYLKRLTSQLQFSPSRIIVKEIHVSAKQAFANLAIENGQDRDMFFLNGLVCFQNEQLFFRSIVGAGYSASVVNNEAAFDNIYWGISRINDESSMAQSETVRALVLSKLSAVLNMDGLAIEKDNYSIPRLKKDGLQLHIPISLAHHHHFISYSFALND